ncbi:MAG: glycosyl transferase [Flavobacterium sp. BFFFF1]|uniref:glycosyltransferase family A protein n=1 Tax=Flavobacterium sp. BFFFF1 TaxID=2015557 RepID=UPI000BCCC736|nr:glycosyltransferase family A protein [Flavobacterium sp. BFFFF1]OYU80796.1 MAG: glycosyl transferase [Flavobacterium sp. BFFFF1]
MLAIVIPYFKEAFFEDTLASLAGQSDHRFKVYIGNDAGKVSPLPLLEKYKGMFDCYYKGFSENIGSKSLVKQWERCIALTENEEWIMILGDDDVLGDNVVSTFYENIADIKTRKASVIRYASIVIDGSGNEVSSIFTHPVLESPQDFMIRKLCGKTRSSLSEYIFSREAMQKVKFRDLPLAWNTDLLAVFEFSLGNKIFTINEAKVFFRVSGMNLTSLSENHKLKSHATFQFMLHLMKSWLHTFDAVQREILFDRLEKTFLNNKKNIYFWMQMSWFYLQRFYVKRYILFLLKFIHAAREKYR